MTTDQFIDVLEERQYVPAAMVRQLRQKAAQGDDRITAKSILKYLVKKEIVSRAQAKELLKTALVVSDKAESSILGLTPLADVDEPRGKAPRPAADKRAAADPPRRPAEAKATHRAKSPPPDDDVVLLAPVIQDEPIDFGRPSAAPLLDAAAEEAPQANGRLTSAKSKGKKKKRKRGPKDRTKNEWDSPLLLLGFGGLAVLAVAGVVLWWLLFRENADAILKQANEQYEGGSYTQAISNYEKFVENFPSHQDISDVKVRLGMTKLRRATEGSSDFDGALEMAQQVIDDVEDEPAFTSDGDDEGLSQAKRDLSSLLTTIAKGLSTQAEAEQDPAVAHQRIEQTNAALALLANTKYVPQRLRMDNELEIVRQTIDRVEARQQRQEALASALAKMDEAIAQGDVAAAFAGREALLEAHPVLVDDAKLAAKVLEISAAEKSGVQFVEAPEAAPVAAPSSPIVAELALAERRGAAAAAASDGPIVVRVDGALYGLNAADGAQLWRRFVGLDVTSMPLVLPSGQVIAADSQTGQLVCLAVDSGKLLWRLPLEGELAAAVPAGERLLVASAAGKLYVVDGTSGRLMGHVQFSQPIRVSPVVSERGDRIYVLGEHSSLYTLSAADFSCLGVYYLGHAAGAAPTAPIVALNKLIIAVNSGAETCLIRTLSLDDAQVPSKEVVTRRLTGLVVTPLQSAGRRFAAITTHGQAVVFEVGAADDKTALTALATRDAQDSQPIARFALVHEGHLWLAGRQLAKLAILPTGNQLPVRSLQRDYEGDAFDYPLQAAGNLVIHVRRPAGRAGAIVAAMDATANKAVWETALAVPPAGAPAVDANDARLSAGAASGAVYLLDREAMTRRVQDRAERLPARSGDAPTFSTALDLGNGRLVLAALDAPAVLHYRPGGQPALKLVELPGPSTCAPTAWRDGFVVATDVGQVFFYDGESAAALATPFQPELRPGKEYQWLQPAVVGAGNDSQLAISDRVSKVYLVNLESQPQPHLAETASADVGPSPLVSPLAVLGARIFAGAENGQLVSFAAADLAPGEPIALGGRIVWGPHSLGDGLLLAIESGELMLLGEDGAIRWRRPVEHGAIGGVPLVVGGEAFLIHPSGGLSRINLGDGAEAAYADLGQPVVAGPVALGDRLVLAAPDGSLLVVNRP